MGGPMKQRIVIWCLAVLFSVLVIGSAVGVASYFVNQAHQQNQRRHDNCISRQNLYDGQFVMVHFLAGQFHASEAQEREGVRVLSDTLGVRPDCD